MPKSRNRKTRKVLKTYSQKKWIDDLIIKICQCKMCGNDREYYAYVELGIEEQLFWKEDPDFSSIDYYLSCETCREVSAMYK